MKELQKQDYKNIGINQIFQWIVEIKRDARLTRSGSANIAKKLSI